MTSAVEARGDYDTTGVSLIVRRALVLGVIEAVIVLLMAVITRLLGGVAEAVVGGIVLLIGLAAVTVLPGTWTRARTIEGIAGAAAIGLAAAIVFLLIDVSLFQPFGVYTNRWREIGGGANWWYHPVWWMVGTFLPWMGGLIIANRAARGRDASMAAIMALALVCTLVVGAVAVLVHVPGATWSLGTFGVAFLPGLAIAAALSAMGRSTA